MTSKEVIEPHTRALLEAMKEGSFTAVELEFLSKIFDEAKKAVDKKRNPAEAGQGAT